MASHSSDVFGSKYPRYAVLYVQYDTLEAGEAIERAGYEAGAFF